MFFLFLIMFPTGKSQIDHGYHTSCIVSNSYSIRCVRAFHFILIVELDLTTYDLLKYLILLLSYSDSLVFNLSNFVHFVGVSSHWFWSLCFDLFHYMRSYSFPWHITHTHTLTLTRYVLKSGGKSDKNLLFLPPSPSKRLFLR